jgi:Alpha/beta hydrolase domain
LYSGTPSQFPSAPLYKAALHNLVEWIVRGVAPPRASRITRTHGAIVRDRFGNARGGVRSPYVDTPVVRYVAAAPVVDNDRSRAMFGLQQPLAAASLRRLYRSRENYLARFNRGIDRMARERWLLTEDAAKLKSEEASNSAAINFSEPARPPP